MSTVISPPADSSAIAAGESLGETHLEAPVSRGEEFRDKLTTQGARKTLTREELAHFTQLSVAKSLWCLIQTYGLLALTIALGLYAFSVISPKPLVGAPLLAMTFFLMGCWQHWLAIISHESTHYRLFESRAANDWVGRISGMLIGVSTFSYRIVHRLHHNHLYEEIDPDMALMAGYPRGKAYLWKKLLKDISGFTAWRNYLYFFGAPAANTATGQKQDPLADTTSHLRQLALRDRWIVVGFHVAMPLLMFAIGYGVEYLVLWVLPAITVQAFILRLRAVAEHGAPSDTSTALGAARTNVAIPALVRMALFPHSVNYHLEHHLYPAVPHYRLAELHVLLKQRGVLDGAEVRTFGETMTRVFGARGSAPDAARPAQAVAASA
jgi:fatty acid desaturase